MNGSIFKNITNITNIEKEIVWPTAMTTTILLRFIWAFDEMIRKETFGCSIDRLKLIQIKRHMVQ